jgi:hypothetical protein
MLKCYKCLFYIKRECDLGYDLEECSESAFKSKDVDRYDSHYLSKEEMLEKNYFIVGEDD